MKEASSVADSQNGASKGGTVSTQAAAADLEADVPGSIPQPPRSGPVVETDAQSSEKPDSKFPKKPITERLWLAFKTVLFYSKLNILLIFVPAGIAVAQFHHLSPAIIFTLNLGFATESVAHRLGDSLGALLNVTFGNAVELIIL
jgi:Ca2+:H+ antiporter